MNLVCPNCGMNYPFDDASAPSIGSQIRCEYCSSSFSVSYSQDQNQSPIVSNHKHEIDFSSFQPNQIPKVPTPAPALWNEEDGFGFDLDDEQPQAPIPQAPAFSQIPQAPAFSQIPQAPVQPKKSKFGNLDDLPEPVQKNLPPVSFNMPIQFNKETNITPNINPPSIPVNQGYDRPVSFQQEAPKQPSFQVFNTPPAPSNQGYDRPVSFQQEAPKQPSFQVFNTPPAPSNQGYDRPVSFQQEPAQQVFQSRPVQAPQNDQSFNDLDSLFDMDQSQQQAQPDMPTMATLGANDLQEFKFISPQERTFDVSPKQPVLPTPPPITFNQSPPIPQPPKPPQILNPSQMIFNVEPTQDLPQVNLQEPSDFEELVVDVEEEPQEEVQTTEPKTPKPSSKRGLFLALLLLLTLSLSALVYLEILPLSEILGDESPQPQPQVNQQQFPIQNSVVQNPVASVNAKAPVDDEELDLTQLPAQQEQSWFNQLIKKQKQSLVQKTLAETPSLDQFPVSPIEEIHPLRKLQKDKPQNTIELSEFLAINAIKYPHQEAWAKESLEKLEEFSKNTKVEELTPVEQQNLLRAQIATALANQLDGAQEKAIGFAQNNPNDLLAQELMAYAYAQRQQTQSAQQVFKQIIDKDPSQVSAMQAYAELAHINHQDDQAKAMFQKLYDQNMISPKLLQTLAEIELKKGNLEKAELLMNQLFELPVERISAEEKSKSLSFWAQNLLSTKGVDANAKNKDELMGIRETEAVELAKQAILTSGNNQEAIEIVSAYFGKNAKFQNSLDELQKLSAKVSETPEIAMENAKLYRALDRKEKVLEVLEKASNSYPEHIGLQIAYGSELLSRNSNSQPTLGKAKTVFEKLLKQNPQAFEAHLKMAELLKQEAKVEEGLKYLEEQVKKYPWSSTLLNGMANFKWDLAQKAQDASPSTIKLMKEAQQSYQQVLQINPSLDHARFNMAKIALALQNPKDALVQLEILATHQYPQSLDLAFGSAKQAIAQYDEAMKYYDKVLAKDKNNVQVLRAMGEIYAQKKELSKAKQMIEKALLLNTKDPKSNFDAGKLYINDDPKRAATYFSVALEKDKNNPAIKYWYARALEQTEDPIKAREMRNYYQQAVDSFSVESAEAQSSDMKEIKCDAYYRLGKIKAQVNSELEIAKEHLNQAISCNAKKGAPYLELGQIYQKISNLGQAEGLYQKALSLDPSLDLARVNIAEIILNQGERNKAISQLKQVSNKQSKAQYLLCRTLTEESKPKAKPYCNQYLKLEPNGIYAIEVKALLE